MLLQKPNHDNVRGQKPDIRRSREDNRKRIDAAAARCFVTELLHTDCYSKFILEKMRLVC